MFIPPHPIFRNKCLLSLLFCYVTSSEQHCCTCHLYICYIAGLNVHQCMIVVATGMDVVTLSVCSTAVTNGIYSWHVPSTTLLVSVACKLCLRTQLSSWHEHGPTYLFRYIHSCNHSWGFLVAQHVTCITKNKCTCMHDMGTAKHYQVVLTVLQLSIMEIS